MKLYILRHEDRTMDLTFFSPLTKNGLEKSIDLIKYLDKEQINVVYSSPYIRTLQTIYQSSSKETNQLTISSYHFQDKTDRIQGGLHPNRRHREDHRLGKSYRFLSSGAKGHLSFKSKMPSPSKSIFIEFLSLSEFI